MPKSIQGLLQVEYWDNPEADACYNVYILLSNPEADACYELNI